MVVELTGTLCVCAFVFCSYLARAGPQTDNYSLLSVAYLKALPLVWCCGALVLSQRWLHKEPLVEGR